MLYVFNLIVMNYLNVILHIIYYRLKIQQQFTNDSKYLQRPCQEFHWIVDLIKRYRYVTELVRNKLPSFSFIILISKTHFFVPKVCGFDKLFFQCNLLNCGFSWDDHRCNWSPLCKYYVHYQSKIVIKRRIFNGFYLNKINLIQIFTMYFGIIYYPF